MSGLLKKKGESWNMNVQKTRQYRQHRKSQPKKTKEALKKQRQKQKSQRKLAPKRKFSDTYMALALRLNAPLEYDFILETGGYEPTPEFIESIGYSSLNPYFKSVGFRRTLMSYRRNGCRQWKKAPPPSIEMIRKKLQVRKSYEML